VKVLLNKNKNLNRSRWHGQPFVVLNGANQRGVGALCQYRQMPYQRHYAHCCWGKESFFTGNNSGDWFSEELFLICELSWRYALAKLCRMTLYSNNWPTHPALGRILDFGENLIINLFNSHGVYCADALYLKTKLSHCLFYENNPQILLSYGYAVGWSGRKCGSGFRKIIAFFIGDHSLESCKKLWESIPQQFRNQQIFSDFWSAYNFIF